MSEQIRTDNSAVIERLERERDQLKHAIHKALADYAKGKPVDQIMRELKDVERDHT